MDQETLVQKIEQLSTDLALLSRAVHGTETETVLLGGVATPSYRKLVADVDARESQAAKTEIEKGVARTQAIADSAAQQVQDATALAVGAATEQANRAKGYADAAEAVLPEAIAERVTATETKNTLQDARLDAVEGGVTAITTTLIGSIQTLLCADSYVPNGCVPANGGEYTRAQFPALYDTYLAGGKLLTCTYAAQAAQVGLTGNCAKFALDADNQKFKVPLLKDGDSITQASSAAELGRSVKAGLPNLTGDASRGTPEGDVGFLWSSTSAATGVFKRGHTCNNIIGGATATAYALGFDASRGGSDPIYGNSTTVTDEQVRLRHFVVLASAQNSASVFDWSNYMAALAGKANTDLSNLTPAAVQVIKNSNTASILSTCTTSGDWTITGCKVGLALDIVADVISADANGNNQTLLWTKSGATGGNSSGNDARFAIGRANAYFSTNLFRCYPTSETVVIGIQTLNGSRLTARQ